MKLKGLKLADSILSDLYKKNLVETATVAGIIEPNQKTDSITAPETSKKNKVAASKEPDLQKKILLFVNYKQPGVPEADMNFLNNLLSACRLGPGDVTIMNFDKIGDPSYQSVTNRLSGGILLLFGISPVQLELPVDFPYFQVQSFNGHTFLYTPGLGEIANDKILKSKLWVCLQKIFNL